MSEPTTPADSPEAVREQHTIDMVREIRLTPWLHRIDLDRATSGLGTPVGQFLLIEQDEGGHHLVTDHPTASAAWSFAGEDGFWRVAYLVDLDTGALIPPATPVSSSPEAPADLLAAVEAVRAAIEDTGANPSWHAYTMAIHRAEWPTLWAALDHLVEP